jgi:hypothetical protein
MPNLKTYDLFISHAWKYGDEYEALKNILTSAPLFSYRNYSAPQYKPLQNLDSTNVTTKAEITSAIQRKIKPVNVVLVLSGMYANNRYWMEKEIETAIQFNKPIIAIKPRGNTLIPKFIQEKADIVVNWSTSSIVSAIREYSL